MIESLETRRMNDVAAHARPVYSLDRGTLTIEGSVYDDVIAVHKHNDRVRLSLDGHRVTLHGRVRRAVIFGGKGNDRVDFGAEAVDEDWEDIGASAYIDGGRGNDTIQSGPHADTLFGGQGDDRLANVFDSHEDDYQDGGPGDDTLEYGRTMYGGSGDDVAVEDDVVGDALMAGIERVNYLGEGQDFLGPGPDPGNLFTRNGRLTFAYSSQTDYDTRLIGPTVRDDGRLQITVRNGPFLGPRTLPQHEVTLVLDKEEAARRGVVLSFGRSYSERVVLVPTIGA